MIALGDLLLDTGLLQFGRFGHEENTSPLAFRLEMLPAYPDVLREVIRRAKVLLNGVQVNRLLCVSDSLPLGIGLCLETDIPLVYSRGSDEAAVHDLVGAYDMGHPAVLLLNVLEKYQTISPLVANAARVGLEVHTLFTVVDFGVAHVPPSFSVFSLLRLPDMLDDLVQQGKLPAGQAEWVQAWIADSAAHS